MSNVQILKTAITKLKVISDSPELDVEVLFAHVLGVNREQLLNFSETQINKNQRRSLEKLIQKRKKGVPVAYLTGKKEFYGREFKVTPDVLIPRPETEGLVELALEKVKSYQLTAYSLQLLDLGTGSGCIAISLAKSLYHSKLAITASDISQQALRIAKINAEKHDVKIEFIQSDLFKNLLDKRFDLIVANLPYVPAKDYQNNLFELKAEPKIALTDTTGNWQLITNFIEKLPGHISPNGVILLEIDTASKEIIAQAVQKALPDALLKFHKDLTGRVRYAEIS